MCMEAPSSGEEAAAGGELTAGQYSGPPPHAVMQGTRVGERAAEAPTERVGGGRAGTVTLEVALVSRYWTIPFFIFTVLSYVLVFPFQARAGWGSAPGRVPGRVPRICASRRQYVSTAAAVWQEGRVSRLPSRRLGRKVTERPRTA